MKNPIVIVLCVLVLAGCAKAPAPVSVSPAYTALNATETSLLGTWYLQKQVISSTVNTITYTGYDSNYFITFNHGVPPSVPVARAVATKYFTGSWLPNNPLTPPYPGSNVPALYGFHYIQLTPGQPPTPVGQYDSYWYFDGVHQSIGEVQSLISLSFGVLTVTWTDGVKTIVSTLHQ